MDTVTLTTMQSKRATFLNSKLSSFLHLIPGTLDVHFDLPITLLLVHGIPTSYALTAIAMELTTFNPGLALTPYPKWLTSETSRAGKAASTIVITIMALK